MFVSVLLTIVGGIFLILEAITVHRRGIIIGLASIIIIAWLLPIFIGG